MNTPLADVMRLVDRTLSDVMPLGLVIGRELIPSADWEGSPSLALRLLVDADRVGELSPERSLQLMRQVEEQLSEYGDDRFLHVSYRTPTLAHAG